MHTLGMCSGECAGSAGGGAAWPSEGCAGRGAERGPAGLRQAARAGGWQQLRRARRAAQACPVQGRRARAPARPRAARGCGRRVHSMPNLGLGRQEVCVGPDFYTAGWVSAVSMLWLGRGGGLAVRPGAWEQTQILAPPSPPSVLASVSRRCNIVCLQGACPGTHPCTATACLRQVPPIRAKCQPTAAPVRRQEVHTCEATALQ
jgi:hypothetical protein